MEDKTWKETQHLTAIIYGSENTGAIVHDLGQLGPPVFQWGVHSGTYLVQSWIQPWTNIANGHKTDRNMMCTFLYYKFSQDPFSGFGETVN